jgi:8-oxo-dGTP pyrophosphatase MutT (NUDIX family)
MSIEKSWGLPLHSGVAAGRGLRTQVGALPWRIARGRLELLLITGRRSGRWGVPRGWRADDPTPADAAAREAWEEAGVTGRISPHCLGLYTRVRTAGRSRLPCVVALFPLEVLRLEARWPEHGARDRRWVTREDAGTLVENRELLRLLLAFDPRALS